MKATKVTRPVAAVASIEVILEDVESGGVYDDFSLAMYAAGAANENPTSIFGFNVRRWPETQTVTVTLHRD